MKRDFSNFNGYGYVAAVLRDADPLWRLRLLKELATKSKLLVRVYEDLSFVYSDILRIDEKSVPVLWQVIPEQEWLVAWKLTSDHMREHLLVGLSERRRASFLEQFKGLPKMPRKHVARIQMVIAKKIKKEVEAGRIKLKARVSKSSRPLKKSA